MFRSCCCQDNCSQGELDSIAVQEEPEPESEYPPAVEEPVKLEATSFTALLEDSGKGFGISVDSLKPGLQVLSVKPEGVAAKYNEDAMRDQVIQPDDIIVAVNDVQTNDHDELMKALKKTKKAELKVVRPMQLQVVLQRASAKENLGLDVNFTQVGASLIVRAVKPDGVVAKQNGSAEPEKQLLPQDIIKSANGEGKARAIKDRLAKGLVLELTVLRLPEYS